MAQSLSVRGYAATSVEHVVAEAGVSRASFYEYFENKRDCLIAAHEAAFEGLTGRIFEACAHQQEWALKVRAAIHASLEYVDEDPERARLLVLDALAADLVVAKRVLESNEYLAGLLRSGREHHPQAGPQPNLTEDAVIGAISSIVAGRLLDGDSVMGVEPQLVTFALTPYIGSGEAERIAAGAGETLRPVIELAARS